MDLEKMNGSYERAKQNLEVKKQNIKKIEEEIKKAEGDIKIAEAVKEVAQRQNIDKDVKDAEKAIKDKKMRIEELKKDIELEKEELLMFKEKTDKVIEELRENPELQAHLDQVLAKRYSRKIRDIDNEKQKQEKEQEKEEKKLEGYKDVQKLIDEHASMRNYMQGMLNASYKVEKLNAELAKLDPAKDTARIKQVEQEIATENKRLNQNRDAILKYSNKNKLKITEETLKEIASNSVIDKKNNRVNIKATLNASNNKAKENIKDINKKIKNADKQISINERAIKNLGFRVPERKKEENKDEKDDTKSRNDGRETINQGEGKLKWWQFVKKFKRWNENRKVKKLPAPEDKEINQKNEFFSSLKYDVVKDITKQMQHEKYKEAKKEVREEKQTEEER